MTRPVQRLGCLARRLVRSVLRTLERLLWATALVGLGLFAAARGDAWMFQMNEQWRVGSHLAGLGAPDPPVGGPTAEVSPGEAARPAPPTPSAPDRAVPPPGAALGTIEIPRLGIESIVIEGADRAALRRGVGHITGSALPGAGGTIGLAGHRDGVFRPLEDVRRDDLVIVTGPEGRRRYRVVAKAIVGPSDTWVLAPPRDPAGERLTLVTCYPFRFVGPAPRRFVVYARRENPLP